MSIKTLTNSSRVCEGGMLGIESLYLEEIW